MLRAGPEPWGLPPGDGELCDRPGSDRVSCLLREVRRQIDHCSLPRPVALPLGLFRGSHCSRDVEGLRRRSDDLQAFEGQVPVCVAVTFDKSVNTQRDLFEQWLQSCFLD